MVTKISRSAHDIVIQTPTNQISPLSEVAETIREEAINEAREKIADPTDMELPRLLGQLDFLNAFQYEVALNVANILAKHDQNIQTVYAYDPGLNADSESGEQLPPDMTVHLLVLVTKPSAALEALVKSLDRALTISLRELPSPLFMNREFILDANLVTEEDVKLRRGYGSMLNSLFAPLLKVWQR
jgi:hypothetical protein